MTMSAGLVLCAAIHSLTWNRAYGDEKPDSLSIESRDLCNDVVASFMDSRRRLITGTWRAVGVRKKLDGAIVRTEHPIVYECTFDNRAQLYRFSRDETIALPDGTKKDLGGTSIESSELRVFKAANSNTITLDHPNTRRVTHVKAFDIRCLGCLNEPALLSGVSLEDMFVVGKKILSVDAIVDVSREPGGLARMSWVLGDGGYRATVWFSKREEYCAVKYEGCYLKLGPDRKILVPRQWASPEEIIDVHWKDENGVWLPRSYFSETRGGVRLPPYRSDPTEIVMLEIQWDAVNVPIGADKFGVDAFTTEHKNAMVVDRRRERPTIVKHPAVPSASVVARLERDRIETAVLPKAELTVDVRSTSSRLLLWASVATSGCLVIIFLVVWSRRRS
jgi:hypothetical protein